MSSRLVRAAATLAVAALFAGGCGSSGSGSKTGGGATTNASSGGGVSVDVGGGQTVKVDKGPLKIGLFSAGTSNSFLLAQNDEAQRVAKQLGVQLDVLDGRFDPAVQFNQMQTALASKKYDAWIIEADDANQACDIATRQAPAAGILVSVAVLPLCGHATASADNLWVPGTLNFIGGNETVDSFKAVWEQAIKDNPGPQKVGVMTGPDLNTNTINYLAAMRAVLPSDWTIVGKVATDYSVPDAQAKGQTLAQAHPDMTILMSDYTNITKGGIAGLKAAGRLGKVKIYDAGGTTAAVQFVKDGTVQFTTARYARTPMRVAIEDLIKARKGEQVPHFVWNDGHAPEPGRKPGSPVYLVTKKNVDQYHPEND